MYLEVLAFALAFPSTSASVSVSLRGARSAPNAEELALYASVLDLRRRGFNCPSGKYFPPNAVDVLFDCRVWRAAASFSRDMAELSFFAHIDPSGRDPCEYTRDFGLQACSQSLAAGQADARSALEAWKSSPEHCDGILDPSATHIGVGFYASERSTYKRYWTLNFGADECAVDSSCIGGPEPPPCNPCRDFNSEGCRAYKGYAGSIYCGAPWPAGQCRKTCGFCDDCADDNAACALYQGYAGSIACTASWASGWAVQHCPRTCGLC